MRSGRRVGLMSVLEAIQAKNETVLLFMRGDATSRSDMSDATNQLGPYSPLPSAPEKMSWFE
mgnify:CR=1 FL=1